MSIHFCKIFLEYSFFFIGLFRNNGKKIEPIGWVEYLVASLVRQ